jgi:hypothetical protein
VRARGRLGGSQRRSGQRSETTFNACATALPLRDDISERARAQAVTNDHDQVETARKLGTYAAKCFPQ